MAGVGERGCCFGWLRRQHPSQGNREWREHSSLTDSAWRGRAEVRDPVVPRVTMHAYVKTKEKLLEMEHV